MRITRAQFEQKAKAWLRQGISPRRLALTLALGFTIGCVPVVGVPTVVCTGLALLLGLNIPAIQAANYIAMPFQLALVVPFLKLGARVAAFGIVPILSTDSSASSPLWKAAAHAGSMAGQAFLGWLLVAAPTALFLTLALTLAFKKIPALKNEA